jgi:hypothetical protein
MFICSLFDDGAKPKCVECRIKVNNESRGVPEREPGLISSNAPEFA